MPDEQAMMKLMAAGGGKTGAPAAGTPPSPAGGAPVGAPMMTPQPNEGNQQQGFVKIALALDLLEQALPPFGSETEEGKALMSALSTLSKKFGEQRPKGKEFAPAELKQLMGTQVPSPEMRAAMGGGGGAPGGAPQPPMPQAA